MKNEPNSEYDYRSTEYKVALLSAYEEAQMKSFSVDDACNIIQSKIYNKETAEKAKNIFTVEWFSRQLIPMPRKREMAENLLNIFREYDVSDEGDFYYKIAWADSPTIEKIKYFRAIEFGIPYHSVEYDLFMLYIYEQREMECVHCWYNHLCKDITNHKEAYLMAHTHNIKWFSEFLKPLEFKIQIAHLFLNKAKEFGVIENRDLYERIIEEDGYILNRIKYHISRDS